MPSLSTSASIILGLALAGAFTSAGLYFGIRARPVEAQASAVAPAGSTSLSSAVAIAVPAAAAVPSAAVEGRQAARKAIDDQHDRLVRECWAPSVAREAQPAAVSLTLLLEYGDDGALRVRSLRQDGPAMRPDVTLCVDKILQVPPASSAKQRFRAEIPIRFP
jgi:hypothetical protein